MEMEANPKGDGAIRYEDDAKGSSMASALEWTGLHTPNEDCMEARRN